MGPREPELMQEWAPVLAHPGIDVHLVMPATMRCADLARTVGRFEPLRPAHLIFTHLDETACYGGVLSLAIETGRPVSFLCSGQSIPEDIEPATRAALLRLIGAEPLAAATAEQEEPMNPYQGQAATITPEEREQLILEHMPQVRLIARRIHDRLPETVSLEDLVSTGVVGLISAIDRYDPSHGVKLKTYAEYKIRGAILDSLRGLDWAPRQQRRRSKLIELAISNLEQSLHRAPNEEEIAAELGIAVSEYRDWLTEIRGLNLGSLESHPPDEDGRELLRFVADSEESWPSNLLERAELRRILAQAIARMPAIERTVLGLYFQEELTLREIASVIQLHESRVSQLKTQAIARLRAFLKKKWPTGRGAAV